MEKKEISISLSTVLLFIAILIICVMGYYINRLYIEKSNFITQQNIQNQLENLEEANNNTMASQNNVQNNELDVANSYEEFANKLISKRNNSVEDWYRSTEQLDTGEDITVIIDNKGNAYLQLSGDLADKYGEKYKVLEKVLMCKFVRFNQDVTNYLYFICDDGTVKIVRILSSIEISSEDANDYKDIVNIITTLDMNVEGFEGMPVQKIKLIDINGNIYNVN